MLLICLSSKVFIPKLQRLSRGSGPTILWSPALLGPDPAVFWMSLDSMARMMRASGDTNLSHYSRHLANRFNNKQQQKQ